MQPSPVPARTNVMRFVIPLLCVIGFSGCTSVQSKIEINAPADRVREVFYQFEAYPTWNPFIVKVDGAVTAGNEVQVTVKPVGKAEISGATKVVSRQPDRLIWRGRLAIPGLFSGRHEFVIEADGPNHTIFHNDEKMSGLVIPFYNFEPTELGFAAMNEALKHRAEQSPH